MKRARREQKVIIPSKADLRSLLQAAAASEEKAAAALVALVTFCGLRASELRGLPWRAVNLRTGTVTVNQRADAYNVIGAAKSDAGFRSIPIPPLAQKLLREWKIACPPSDLNLVFPSVAGQVMSNRYMTLKLLDPIQRRAGLVLEGTEADPKRSADETRSETKRGRYTLHDFRHAAASLWIEQRVSPKRVQTWMGHSSIQVTFDVYGHLFRDADRDAAVASAIETELLTAVEDATRMQHESVWPQTSAAGNGL